MLSTFYRVSIAGISGAGDAAGFIDNKKVEEYMANGGTAPTSLVTSTNKTRGNIRYKNVVENLQLIANMYVSNVVATAANADTAPTTFAFTVEVERGDSVLVTRDDSNTAVEISGANAIVRGVARAIVETRNNYVYPVYDPTKTTAPQNGSTSNAAVRNGTRVNTFNIAQLANSISTAESSVTVTKLV